MSWEDPRELALRTHPVMRRYPPEECVIDPFLTAVTKADHPVFRMMAAGLPGILLSRTGTTPGNPSATSTQLPPWPSL